MKPLVKGRATIEEELARRRERLFAGHQRELLDALRDRIPALTDAIVLRHVPEQLEDIFAVLIDEDSVAIIEIARDPSPRVVAFDIVSANDYGKNLSGRSSRQLMIAREMISGSAR